MREPNITLIRDLPSHQLSGACVATIGNFDGLHLAHRHLIEKCVETAKAKNLNATVITFEPYPQSFLRPDPPLLRLTSLRQKISLLKTWGITQVICLRFNKAFSQLSPQEFIEKILVKALNVKHLMVGEDFRFGHQQAGNVALLQHHAKQFNFQVEAVRMIQSQEQKISSTAIRQSLMKGDLSRAKAMLGRFFSICEHVIYGDARGRTLGFPTANIPLMNHREVLKGVFITQQMIDHKKYYGVANVGTRPTVDGKHYLAEVHLLNYSGNLYGKRLKVEFLHKIRNEQRFANLSELQQQIHRDIQVANSYILTALCF